MYTNKANLLQFRLSSKEYLLPLLEGKRKSSDCSSAACPHTVKLSTLTMQPVHYHYKKQSVKHMEKTTLLSLNIAYSKICAIKRYHRTAVKLCKTFCFRWILERVKQAYIKGK